MRGPKHTSKAPAAKDPMKSKNVSYKLQLIVLPLPPSGPHSPTCAFDRKSDQNPHRLASLPGNGGTNLSLCSVRTHVARLVPYLSILMRANSWSKTPCSRSANHNC